MYKGATYLMTDDSKKAVNLGMAVIDRLEHCANESC